jgi:hypothetical protein
VFIGHFALGFAAKRLAPAVSLGTLFLACQLADLVWPNLVLLVAWGYWIDRHRAPVLATGTGTV